MRGIIVLDGADGTGKSTLAKVIVDRFDGRYLHLGYHKDIWRWHLAATRLAIRLAQKQLVVIDRLWLSEQVYGQVFRGGPAYDFGARFLDLVLQQYGAITVLCVRDNQLGHLKHFEQLKTTRPEKFNDIAKVIRLYTDLKHGNFIHTGKTYIDRYIRWGDFTDRPDVVTYDMDKLPLYSRQFNTFVDAVASEAAAGDTRRAADLDELIRRML